MATPLQRVCNINAVIANPDIPLFKVYASAGLQGKDAKGQLSVGPPAWNDQTEYFTGDVTAVERTVSGVKLAASGTFGTRIQREGAAVFVEVADGKVSVRGLSDDFTVTNAKVESGSVSVYTAVANPTN